MIKRREVVLGGALLICWGSSCACAAPHHNPVYGCVLPDEEAKAFFDAAGEVRLFASGNEPVVPKSGDPLFDYALAQTLLKISDVLDVSPGFAYYDDGNEHNAYATRQQRLNGADGTVLFGRGMLSKIMARPEHPDVAISAVCAHEFGHILQFKHSLEDKVLAGQPTVKRLELQADYFAGYFAGKRKLEKPDYPAAVFAMTQESFGDNQLNHPGHHGTPDERAAAIVQGFQAGKENKSLPAAIELSLNYVHQL